MSLQYKFDSLHKLGSYCRLPCWFPAALTQRHHLAVFWETCTRGGPQCWTRMSLKTWSLLFLIVPLAVAEVVDKLSKCPGFLLDETPPQMTGILVDGKILDQNRYKTICQTYEDIKKFLTLYDITNRIPVFSAYKFIGEKDKDRPPMTWMIEPQLEDVKDPEKKKNMMSEDIETKFQAENADYEKSGFHKGHLFPNSHASSTSDKEATFTLTNAVPQASSFNQGGWSQMEKRIKGIMLEYCIDNNGKTEGFVIVGAEPGTDKIPKPPNGRVNVPSKLWSTFCCYSSDEKKWIAGAYWGKNVNDKQVLQMKTLEELQKEMDIVKLFPDKCPLKEKFDPDVKRSSLKRPAGDYTDPTIEPKIRKKMRMK